MPLGPRAGGIFSKRYAPTLSIERHRCKARIGRDSADPKMLHRRPNQQHHCSTLRWTLGAKRAWVPPLARSATLLTAVPMAAARFRGSPASRPITSASNCATSPRVSEQMPSCRRSRRGSVLPATILPAKRDRRARGTVYRDHLKGVAMKVHRGGNLCASLRGMPRFGRIGTARAKWDRLSVSAAVGSRQLQYRRRNEPASDRCRLRPAQHAARHQVRCPCADGRASL